MEARVLHELQGRRTFVVVLRTGEEVLRELRAFAGRQKIVAAQFTAIGALSDAVLAYFDWEKQDYQSSPVRRQVEVVSLVGELAGGRSLRIHAILAGREGTALAGYLTQAHVRPKLEVTINATLRHSRKIHDPEGERALIDLNPATGSSALLQP